MDLPLLYISYKRIIQYVAFCEWLLSPSIAFLRFIYVVTCINILSFLLLNRMPYCSSMNFWSNTLQLALHVCPFSLVAVFNITVSYMLANLGHYYLNKTKPLARGRRYIDGSKMDISWIISDLILLDIFISHLYLFLCKFCFTSLRHFIWGYFYFVS